MELMEGKICMGSIHKRRRRRTMENPYIKMAQTGKRNTEIYNKESESMEFHIFTDASKVAYCSAVYIRYIDEERLLNPICYMLNLELHQSKIYQSQNSNCYRY